MGKVGSDGVSVCASSDECDATSLMLRSIPEQMTRPMLEDLFDVEGFRGCYDFLYLPCEISTKTTFGYAFVNFVSPAAAASFRKHFNGFSRWKVCSSKCGSVHTSTS